MGMNDNGALLTISTYTYLDAHGRLITYTDNTQRTVQLNETVLQVADRIALRISHVVTHVTKMACGIVGSTVSHVIGVNYNIY